MTQTVTHITIVFYGLGITNLQLLAPNSEKSKKLFEFCLQNILLQICAEVIMMPTVLFLDSTVGFIC